MQQQTVTADFRTLAIDQLRESSTTPRRSFDQDKLQELAQSIRAQEFCSVDRAEPCR